MRTRVDFGEAEKQFQGILTLDPHRIDNIDIYSDILYVTDNRIKLSKLAHEFLEIDKDRPEVCCLVGEISRLTSMSDRGELTRFVVFQGTTIR
jgi:hypothetical protein